MRAGLLVGDRLLSRPLRRLAHQDAPGLGGRLDARGGIDEVARNHALALGAERHRCLTRQHTGPGCERRVELGNRGHEVECGPDRALGVVLSRCRRSPDRHHRVADELLDRPAVALDQRAGRLEVAREKLAHLLRVTRLGESREADQIREEHRDEAPLGGGSRARDRLGDLACGRCAAVVTKPHRWVVRRTAVGAGLAERTAAPAAEAGAGGILSAAVRAEHLVRSVLRPALSDQG